jgi:inorganic triphosphatase YgiF
MAAGAETGLKFLFAERDLAKIKALISAVPAARAPRHQRLRAIYFDTPNCDLWTHGFTLRIRESGRNRIQTIKRESLSGIERGEWEEHISACEPDFGLLEKTPLASLAANPSIRTALRPAFEVNVQRVSHWLETGGGVIEASLDHGTIEANGGKLGVRELKLELKSGGRPALFNLARVFMLQAPLHLSPISKAERGHLLAKGVFGLPAKSSKPRLGKDMTCGQAFQEICQTCLHDFDLNRPGLEKLDKAEAVHQARIAIRRLRAALALFKPMVFDIAYRKIRGELKWLARLLGTARDLDVLQEHLQQEAEGPARSRAQELAGVCESGRLEARGALSEALNSERGRILFLDLALWLSEGRWQSQFSDIMRAPLPDFVCLQLKKHLKKLVAEGEGLASLAPGPRHHVRIMAKELRYMAEPFIDVPGITQDRKRLKKLVDCCEKLQASLGLIRDEEVSAEFLESGVWGGASSVSERGEPAVAASCKPRRVKGGLEKELKKALRAYSKLASIQLS